MSDNSYEYMIKQKSEGAALIKKLSAAALYLVFAIVTCTLSIIFPPIELRLFCLFLSVAATAFLIFVTWRFLCVEYEFLIESGDLTVTIIYGKLSRKKLLRVPISSISEMGDYNDEAYEEISKLSIQKNYICLSSLSAPTVFYALFDEEKDRCILYFDVTERAAELLKKLNSGAFRAAAKRVNHSNQQ